VAWRSVTTMVERVVADALDGGDLLANVTRIGIDEIAHRKGQRYLTAVTDHDTGRLIWAAPGRDRATVEAFFDALGPERSRQVTHVSADGAEWIHAAVVARAPQATHDDGRPGQTNSPVYRAYLMKEQIRDVFKVKGDHGEHLLNGLISWAGHSKLAPFVKLARTIRHYRPYISNTLQHGLSNARSEATNVHLRTLTRRAYGFHSPEALIAMAMQTRGGICPDLPGRS
jgi:transposase